MCLACNASEVLRRVQLDALGAIAALDDEHEGEVRRRVRSLAGDVAHLVELVESW